MVPRGLGELGFYKLYDNVELPRKATIGSACFDIQAYLIEGQELKSRDCIYRQNIVEGGKVRISPRGRMLIPTGLIADIPEFHSIRIYPRSGLSFDIGLALANQEGIVDSDYKEEIFISLINMSNDVQTVSHKMRIAQGEVVAHQSYRIKELDEPPIRTSSRSGGFGSTG